MKKDLITNGIFITGMIVISVISSKQKKRDYELKKVAYENILDNRDLIKRIISINNNHEDRIKVLEKSINKKSEDA